MRDRDRRLRALEGYRADGLPLEVLPVWVEPDEDLEARLAEERAAHPRRTLVALRWRPPGPDEG